MRKILAKELGIGNTDLSIRLWGILTTHEFDMGNPGLIERIPRSYAPGLPLFVFL